MSRFCLGMLTAAAALAAACSSIDCPVENTVAVRYGIYTTDGINEVSDTLQDSLWVWIVRGKGRDTLLLNGISGLSSFALHVSYQRPVDTLIFHLSDTLHRRTVDTVFLSKTDTPHFESVDCSAHFFHRLTAVRSTHRAIDTITINQPAVNYDQTQTHLHIYFKDRR